MSLQWRRVGRSQARGCPAAGCSFPAQGRLGRRLGKGPEKIHITNNAVHQFSFILSRKNSYIYYYILVVADESSSFISIPFKHVVRSYERFSLSLESVELFFTGSLSI